MSTAVATSQQVQGELQLQRPTRALIGWMAAEEAAQWIAGPGQAIGSDHRETVGRARAAVAARAAGPRSGADDSAGAAWPCSASRSASKSNSASARFFQEGGDIAIADLSRVWAIQQHVFSDDALQRVADVDPTDIVSIASVSLPIAEPRPMAVAFNPQKQAWLFSSANPNLRIAGPFQGPVQPGVHAFGFFFTVSTSFIQVAHYRGRYLLRDGYHRAYGFLARGITHVPVLIREYATFDEMTLPSGLLPQDTYLGDRPPLLADYVDDSVSAAVAIPVTQKVVIIQGLEVATPG